LNNGSGCGPESRVWLHHECEFYAERICAGGDARTTAGPETGATTTSSTKSPPASGTSPPQGIEDFKGPYAEWKGKHN
jgi:hypothetical protein